MSAERSVTIVTDARVLRIETYDTAEAALDGKAPQMVCICDPQPDSARDAHLHALVSENADLRERAERAEHAEATAMEPERARTK